MLSPEIRVAIRATLSMIDCAVATQTNGVAEALYASMNAWILFTRSATLRNEPRLLAGYAGHRDRVEGVSRRSTARVVRAAPNAKEAVR